ncbi:hypothetical protein R1flu_001330 [Riccia fluitans]|uniref:Uncharacterized protein n=1 Tax=Riccia fluitans TaxID=41844 RepID=A0ABD1Y3E3_9MARC
MFLKSTREMNDPEKIRPRKAIKRNRNSKDLRLRLTCADVAGRYMRETKARMSGEPLPQPTILRESGRQQYRRTKGRMRSSARRDDYLTD